MRSVSVPSKYMVEAVIEIEVVYAAVERQVLVSVAVPVGTTVRAAVLLSLIHI